LPMRLLDVDDDDKPDLIFADQSSSTVVVYRNTSAGETISFAPKIEFPSGQANSWLTLGDLDGDGKPDVVTNSNTSGASILRNQSTPGNISFAAKIDIGTVRNQEDVNIADMNGDGKVDIVVSTPVFIAPPPPRTISIFKNNSTQGNISFASNAEYLISASYEAHVISVIDDFNNDGKLDIGSTYNGLFSVIANQIGAPGVASFNPISGSTATIVTITGNNFIGATSVSFGGIPASSFTVDNSTTITAVVGNGASGSISVTTPGGTASLTGFTFISAPTITSFTPTTAGTGATVTITGTNLTGVTAVSFGGMAASSFLVNSSTNITAVVGAGASGNVSVTTSGGIASLAGFIYSPVTGIVSPGNVNSSQLTVYPNPSSSWIVISHPATIKNSTLKFIDILGQEVKVIYPSRNSDRTYLKVNDLPKGFYTITWSDGIRNLSRTMIVQ